MTDIFAGDYYTRNFQETMPGEETLVLNLGPQHPSTHGVLRVIVELDGEYVLRAEPVLGYIHRMHEKMGETKSWVQFWPNPSRVDYLHAIAWNWAYAGAVEKLTGMEVPERAEFLRVISCELNRISSHLVWWGAYLLDLGAFTPIMYAFQDREMILDMLQIPTGSRLTYSYFRFGGVSGDINDEFITRAREFIPHMRKRLPMYKDLVTDNIILRRRTEGVGVIPVDMCRRYGATGPVLRGSGVAYDTRKAEPYGIYDRFEWKVPVYDAGDIFARYMVRLDEIEQSLNIVEQALDMLPEGDIGPKKKIKPMFKAAKGEAYFACEGGRGKIGVYVVGDGSKTPYRVKLRAPGYSNLHLFAEAAKGTLLADALAILGSLDLVIPEIDR
jgi:NADH-quinone oxidoreductase subunit D